MTSDDGKWDAPTNSDDNARLDSDDHPTLVATPTQIEAGRAMSARVDAPPAAPTQTQPTRTTQTRPAPSTQTPPVPSKRTTAQGLSAVTPRTPGVNEEIDTANFGRVENTLETPPPFDPKSTARGLLVGSEPRAPAEGSGSMAAATGATVPPPAANGSGAMTPAGATRPRTTTANRSGSMMPLDRSNATTPPDANNGGSMAPLGRSIATSPANRSGSMTPLDASVATTPLDANQSGTMAPLDRRIATTPANRSGSMRPLDPSGAATPLDANHSGSMAPATDISDGRVAPSPDRRSGPTTLAGLDSRGVRAPGSRAPSNSDTNRSGGIPSADGSGALASNRARNNTAPGASGSMSRSPAPSGDRSGGISAEAGAPTSAGNRAVGVSANADATRDGGVVVVATGADGVRVRRVCQAHSLLVPIMPSLSVAHDAMSVVVIGEPSPPAPDRVVHVVRPTLTDAQLAELLRALSSSRVLVERPAQPASPDRRALDFAQRIARMSDRAAIETTMIEALTVLVDADRAYCWFFDPASGALWSEGQRLALGDNRRAMGGLVGWAAYTGQTIHASPSDDDARFLLELDDPEGKPQSRTIVQPIIGSDHRVHAVLVAVRRWRNAPFDDADLSVLSDLAALCAPALDLVASTGPRGTRIRPANTVLGPLANAARDSAVVDARSKRASSRPPPLTARPATTPTATTPSATTPTATTPTATTPTATKPTATTLTATTPTATTPTATTLTATKPTATTPTAPTATKPTATTPTAPTATTPTATTLSATATTLSATATTLSATATTNTTTPSSESIHPLTATLRNMEAARSGRLSTEPVPSPVSPRTTPSNGPPIATATAPIAAATASAPIAAATVHATTTATAPIAAATATATVATAPIAATTTAPAPIAAATVHATTTAPAAAVADTESNRAGDASAVGRVTGESIGIASDSRRLRATTAQPPSTSNTGRTRPVTGGDRNSGPLRARPFQQVAIVAAEELHDRAHRVAKTCATDVTILTDVAGAPADARIITIGQAWSPTMDPRVVYVARDSISNDALSDLITSLASGRVLGAPAQLTKPTNPNEARRAQQAFTGSRTFAAASNLVVAETSAVATMRELLDADRAYLLFYDDADGSLKSAVRGKDERRAIAGIAGWVARTGRAASTERAAADPRWLGPIDDPDGDANSQLIVEPVIVGDRVRAVLVAARRPRRPGFVDADVQLLARFAALLAPLLDQLLLHADSAPPVSPPAVTRGKRATEQAVDDLREAQAIWQRLPMWSYAAAGSVVLVLIALAASC